MLLVCPLLLQIREIAFHYYSRRPRDFNFRIPIKSLINITQQQLLQIKLPNNTILHNDFLRYFFLFYLCY